MTFFFTFLFLGENNIKMSTMSLFKKKFCVFLFLLFHIPFQITYSHVWYDNVDVFNILEPLHAGDKVG